MWYLVTLLSLSSLVNGGGVPQVPCYFIFGASLYDNGNNNAFVTAARANYPPYGIDFRRGPTGRFTNGRNTADIIAELLGFYNYIPPFASARGQDILKGVNYASGSSEIRDETGQHLNRSDYMYWDAVHPTEAANVMVAGRSYVNLDPSDTYPIDIHRLAQL
ncbi:hypothetical protein LWI29_032742 [Acer saccharum]|uniref:GDSL esterase/lipase n=1 Tax=Acer saccharum TaxID=4024 RepID=A0AA39VRX6_ACESA|nr:hypothetical protein LWI29_032742 [Acer saccharum]